MRVLDLFSGIGGFSLGLERAGMKTVAFVEREPFCQKVLAKHWPEVPIYDDVKTYRGDEHECDVVCGGFPCQDISFAGRGAGLAGERSGLWSEMARIISVARPRYVIVENVSALLSRGLGTVLGDLAEIGYDTEWHCIPASYVGAPHRRDRVWVVANARSQQHESGCDAFRRTTAAQFFEGVADSEKLFSDGSDDNAGKCVEGKTFSKSRNGGGSGNLAYPDSERLERQRADRHSQRREGPQQGPAGLRHRAKIWDAEPDVGRVAHGVPARVDRLKGLGNAVVPQIPEMIGRAILETADG